MRAIVSESADRPLKWVEVPEPPLSSNELRVRVQAAGVNPADWKLRSPMYLGVARKIVGRPGPLVCGIDFAGVVDEVGARVGFPRVGDRVVGATDFSRGQHGSYAEAVHVRPDQVALIPDEVSSEEAACLPVPGVTAYRALFELGKLADDLRSDPRLTPPKVLVLGASGGVGHLAVQLARSRGASVCGVCSAKNADFVKELGARPIDYGSGDALTLAEPHGPFHVILDAIGSQTYPIERCVRLLTPKGVHVLCMPRPRDAHALLEFWRVKTLLGRPRSKILTTLVADVAAKRIRVAIAERIPLAEAERAHKVSKQGHVTGKLVLVAST